MTTTQAPIGATRMPLVRRMGVWMTAHAVDDFYQGLIPAAIPFFVLDRGYSYTAASGLALAATLGSSLPQPLFGIIADRRRMPWMSPLGVTVAGVGAGAAGLAQQYWLVWAMLLLSGLGVAAFHPAAGKGARRDAAGSTSAMSLFAAGGSVGFFLAPALVTPALVELGLGATAIFVPPAVLIGFVLWRHELRARTRATTVTDAAGRDRWVPFALLTALEVARSVTFFGVNTFIGVYWIRGLGASQGLGGIALAAFLVGGVGGTLLGGRLGDRLGAVRAVQAGSMLVIPALILLRVVPEPRVALACAVLAGISVNLPFGVLVKLGQDYLPSRPGTAAGVTLGLAVSVGGLFTPVLGELADRHGPGAVFTALCAVPVAAVVLSLMLPQPDGA